MVFLEISTLKIAMIVTLIFSIILLAPAIKLILRFYGKLKASIIYLTFVILTLILSGVFLLFDIIPMDYYEITTVSLNFTIAFFIFLTLISLRKMIKLLDSGYNKETFHEVPVTTHAYTPPQTYRKIVNNIQRKPMKKSYSQVHKKKRR